MAGRPGLQQPASVDGDRRAGDEVGAREIDDCSRDVARRADPPQSGLGGTPLPVIARLERHRPRRAPDVRVCGVAPGPVALEPGDDEERRAAETALRRVGSPEDVAGAILYLAGAGFVTGTTIAVDGGRLLQTGSSGHA